MDIEGCGTAPHLTHAILLRPMPIENRSQGRKNGVGYGWLDSPAGRAPIEGRDFMLLIIDNYDSFTYNLAQRFGELDSALAIHVVRNDQVDLDQIERWQPSHIVISPGPCTPNEAGISIDVVHCWSGRVPLLGVCLGHQSIGQANGATIARARRLMHGKTDAIHHDGKGLFIGLPTPMTATRYHSLVIEPTTLAPDFDITAWTHDDEGHLEIMGIQHRTKPTFGLQFHPESFLTELGPALLLNFLRTGTT